MEARKYAAVSVRDLHKHFDNGLVRALNGIALDIGEGDFVSIMGPSGCGKSTLLTLIGALDLQTKGEILIFGKNLADHKPWDVFRARTIGFVFQSNYLIPSITLLENVELPMYSLRVPKRQMREKAEKLLVSVGLRDRMHFVPPRVSGGERQRAAVARALVNGPRVILADEPTGSVDTKTGGLILDFLTDYCRQRNVTMLMATHNNEISARASSVVYMEDGMIRRIETGA